MCNEAGVKYDIAIYYKNKHGLSPEEAIKKALKPKKRTQEERCNEAGFLADSVRKYSKTHNLSFDAALERLKQSPNRMTSNKRPRTGNVTYDDIKSYMESHKIGYMRARQILTGEVKKSLEQIKEEYGLSKDDIKELCKKDNISFYTILYQMQRYCLSYEEARDIALSKVKSKKNKYKIDISGFNTIKDKCKADGFTYAQIYYYMKDYNLSYEGAKEKILNKEATSIQGMCRADSLKYTQIHYYMKAYNLDYEEAKKKILNKEATSIQGMCRVDNMDYQAVYHQMHKYGLTYEEAKDKVNELYKASYEKQLFIEKCNRLGIDLYEIRMFKNYRKLGYNDDTIEAYMKHLEEKKKPSLRTLCEQEGIIYNRCRQYIKNHKLSKDIDGIKIYKAYSEEKERKHNERKSRDKRII